MKNKAYARDGWTIFAMSILSGIALYITGLAEGPASALVIIASAFLPWAVSDGAHRHHRAEKWHRRWRNNSDVICIMSRIAFALTSIVCISQVGSATQAGWLAVVVLAGVSANLFYRRASLPRNRNADRFYRGRHTPHTH